jgi:hypothetical protein
VFYRHNSSFDVSSFFIFEEAKYVLHDRQRAQKWTNAIFRDESAFYFTTSQVLKGLQD